MKLLGGFLLLLVISQARGQGTTSGEACILPFRYLGEERDSCITDNNGGAYWCATTDNFDRDKKAGNCSIEVETTGLPCHMPTWRINNDTFVGCTTRYMGFPWCGTVPILPEDIQEVLIGQVYSYCKPPTPPPTPRPPDPACDVATTGGTAVDGSDCVFPFNYKGRRYLSCVRPEPGTDKKGAWCSITSNYIGMWGHCHHRKVKTRTTNGKECVFPFKYLGKSYLYCPSSDSYPTPWCATTGDYDKDEEWGNCLLPICTNRA